MPPDYQRSDGMFLTNFISGLNSWLMILQPQGDIFGGPPIRRRKQQPKPALDTINERPKTALPKQPASPVATAGDGNDSDGENGGDLQPKKVHKGQINALAKMLSALKTSRGRE